MPKICKKCGYERREIERVSESECPNCGAIYTKVEARLKREAEELFNYKEKTEKVRQAAIARCKQEEGKKAKIAVSFQKENIQLDCSACKSRASMEATKIPKFNTILRIIGFIIITPSVIVIFIAIIMFIASISAISTIGFGFSFFIGCSSLVSGVIGWFLIAEKKVYKCINCGFILDRA